MKCAWWATACVVLVVSGCTATTTTIDFEGLSSVTEATPGGPPVTLNKPYYVGTIFVEHHSGVKMIVTPFQWPDKATWTDKGFIQIVSSHKAGGSGNEIHFDNACLAIISPTEKAIKSISAKFGEYGGNINVIANGVLHNYQRFALIPSPMAGDLTITVTGGLPLGEIQLSGKPGKFYYVFPDPANPGQPNPKVPPSYQYSAVIGGGQELWMDDFTIEFAQ